MYVPAAERSSAARTMRASFWQPRREPRSTGYSVRTRESRAVTLKMRLKALLLYTARAPLIHSFIQEVAKSQRKQKKTRSTQIPRIRAFAICARCLELPRPGPSMRSNRPPARACARAVASAPFRQGPSHSRGGPLTAEKRLPVIREVLEPRIYFQGGRVHRMQPRAREEFDERFRARES